MNGRRPGTRTVLLAAVVATAWTAAGAAKLPDWAAEIASAAPSVPEGVPEQLSRVLFREQRVEVQEDGRFLVRVRSARQALGVESEHVGVGYFPFREGARIKTSRVWHLPPEGKAKKSKKTSALDLTVDDAFLTDQKVRVVGIDDVEKGSIVFFEFLALESPPALTVSEAFFEYDAVDREYHAIDLARLDVIVPPGWTVRHQWLRSDGPEPVVSGSRHRWEFRDLAGDRDERLADDPAHLAPLLVVGIDPPEGHATAVPAFRDWSDLSEWFEGLASSRAATSDAIASVGEQALAGAGDDVLSRVRAAAIYVRDKVRYVAKAVGIGGYQPRPADETLSTLYGDCKDKGTLLRAMLAAHGIEAYPVLVNASSPSTVAPAVPTPTAFDHMILAVPLPDGEGGVPAVGEAGELGRLLYVDTTNEYASIGWLPADLEGKQALVVTPRGGQLVTLPGGDSAAHRIERRQQAEVGAGGELTVERVTQYYGDPAMRQRYSHLTSSRDRRTAVEGALRDVWLDAEVSLYEVTPEAEDGAFVERIRFSSPLPVVAGAGARLPLFGGGPDPLPGVPLRRRDKPVVYRHPLAVRMETTVRGLSAAAELPEPRDTSGDGWKVDARFEREGALLEAACDFKLERTRFEPDRFRELRRLHSALGRASDAAVRFPE